MDKNFEYESLWQAVYKEKRSNELQLLPKTFYKDITEHIINLKTKEENQEIRQNTIKLINTLFELRKQKILIYIAHNKSLPQPTIDTEQEFYENVLRTYKNKKLDFGNEKNNKHKELDVIKDIPEIILPSGRKLGPLKKGDKLSINNKEDLEFLISTAICGNIQ